MTWGTFCAVCQGPCGDEDGWIVLNVGNGRTLRFFGARDQAVQGIVMVFAGSRKVLASWSIS